MDETQEEEVAKNKGGRPPKREQKARAKQPPKLSRRKHAKLSRALREANKDPGLRARRAQIMAKARLARTIAPRLGVPDGWTREKAEVQRVYDGIKADLLIDRMKANGMVDETKPGDFEVLYVEVQGKKVEVRVPKTEAAMAEAALREAVIRAVSPLTHAKDQLGYIRTVLEWTKPKPAQTSNVNLNSEDWLAEALKDNDATYDSTDEDEGAEGAS
jgi:hypothetical protein